VARLRLPEVSRRGVVRPRRRLDIALLAATHVPVLVASGPAVGGAAMLVAAVATVPLAYLYETGRDTVWAPALVHTAIDRPELVVLPAAALTTFSLTVAAVSLVVPLLALAVPRRFLKGGGTPPRRQVTARTDRVHEAPGAADVG
jgi:hypothetical protein